MSHDALLHRTLEQETVGAVGIIRNDPAQRCHQCIREILGDIFCSEVAHVEAQSLFYEFISVFAVAFFQPAIHSPARFRIEPDGHLFFRHSCHPFA